MHPSCYMRVSEALCLLHLSTACKCCSPVHLISKAWCVHLICKAWCVHLICKAWCVQGAAVQAAGSGADKRCVLQLGGFAFIGEGIPVGLGAAFRVKYAKVCPTASKPWPADKAEGTPIEPLQQLQQRHGQHSEAASLLGRALCLQVNPWNTAQAEAV